MMMRQGWKSVGHLPTKLGYNYSQVSIQRREVTMRRKGLKAMYSSLGGMALGIGFLAQEPPGRPLGIPMWGWILLFALVIIVAVIWVLREEEQEATQKEEAPEPAAVRATLAVEEAAPPLPEPDDLQRIEGIGPKISGLLQENGISTFGQLAETDVDRLEQILDEAGLGRLADPGTWPEQASLAAAGDWAALEALQDQLLGGRQVGPDDLQTIEGIGPKIAGVLQAAGITTFTQLAQADVNHLREILTEAGISRISDPGTWPEQAKLAADGDWQALEALQDQLKGGRLV
jgi:predicted flap endonuclease-1-like 5' DNA nuclease